MTRTVRCAGIEDKIPNDVTFLDMTGNESIHGVGCKAVLETVKFQGRVLIVVDKETPLTITNCSFLDCDKLTVIYADQWKQWGYLDEYPENRWTSITEIEEKGKKNEST